MGYLHKMLNVKGLQLFVGQINAELFQAVGAQALKPKDIQDACQRLMGMGVRLDRHRGRTFASPAAVPMLRPAACTCAMGGSSGPSTSLRWATIQLKSKKYSCVMTLETVTRMSSVCRGWQMRSWATSTTRW